MRMWIQKSKRLNQPILTMVAESAAEESQLREIVKQFREVVKQLKDAPEIDAGSFSHTDNIDNINDITPLLHITVSINNATSL